MAIIQDLEFDSRLYEEWITCFHFVLVKASLLPDMSLILVFSLIGYYRSEVLLSILRHKNVPYFCCNFSLLSKILNCAKMYMDHHMHLIQSDSSNCVCEQPSAHFLHIPFLTPLWCLDQLANRLIHTQQPSGEITWCLWFSSAQSTPKGHLQTAVF